MGNDSETMSQATSASMQDMDFANTYREPSTFATINRMIMRDLNDYRRIHRDLPWFIYTRDQIKKFLADPITFRRELRKAVSYLYCVSSHFRRLILYFAGLSDLSYVVAPYKIDVATAKAVTVKRNYRRVLNLLSGMNIKDQFEKVLIVCLREDVFFGTIRETADSCIIQQLPSDYCAISVIEDNVFNVTFDFSYFDSRPQLLGSFPEEFAIKYRLYHGDDITHGDLNLRWQELDAPNSFAIKFNKDTPEYPMPPFAGILREIFDIEDYKNMKKDKENIENYAMIAMNLGTDDEGNWQMDLDKAKAFYRNLDAVLPDEIGSVLTPMPLEKISFERTHNGDTDAVAEAEQELFTAAGVSSLLFNNVKASSSALLLSIKADQTMTYSIVKSIETMLNRFIRRHNYGKYFCITFLDTSTFNRKEVAESYLKACTYGFPMLAYFCAAQGMPQSELDTMTFLENDVLGLKSKLVPLMSSATMSSSTDEDASAGRPQSEIGELSDSGEVWRERGETE